MDNWNSVAQNPPKDNVVVMTKIDDAAGVRNEAKMYKSGSLWFLADGSMYVYYRPTHWKPL